jgi:hypothetical protein
MEWSQQGTITDLDNESDPSAPIRQITNSFQTRRPMLQPRARRAHGKAPGALAAAPGAVRQPERHPSRVPWLLAQPRRSAEASKPSRTAIDLTTPTLTAP